MPDSEKSNNNKKLPNEILSLILCQLDKQDLMVCQYVCKSWYFQARIEFYKTVVIKGHQCSKIFLSCVEQEKTDIGNYVKYITILLSESESKYRKVPPFTNKWMSQRLFKGCPNIEKISLGELNPFYMLLTLKNRDNNQVYLENLFKIAISKTLCRTPSVHKLYLLANMAYSSTITHLYIFNNHVNAFLLKDTKGGLVEYLSHFYHLENLSVKNVNPSQPFTAPIAMPSILSTLSHLKKVKFHSHQFYIEQKDLVATTEYTKLRKLKLELIHLSPIDIKYIIKTFPQLDYFYVKSTVRITWPSIQERQEVVDLFKKFSTKLKDTNFMIELA